MKINFQILTEILDCMPLAPPEAGGIIGGREGRVCLWKYDAGYTQKGCAYFPNVDFLNIVIEEWIAQDCDFMGVVHVHFGGAKTLSDGDKRYIGKIMEAMPDSIRQLYFPLVVQPDRELISYIAVKNMHGEIEIISDDIELIDY